MKSLILNDNRVSDPGVQCISKALSENNSNFQTQHLAEMLKTNQSLTTLGLAGIRDVQSWIKVVSEHNTTLQRLYLHQNNFISDSIVETLFM